MKPATGSDLTPKRIHVDRKKGVFEIAWQDAGGILALSEMRRACPCALCDDLRGKSQARDGLHMISDVEMPSDQLTGVVPVGNYAVQMKWADGHDTGIYTYAYLREIIGAKSE
ncbi:MAG: DUF971 domain-containing protein [bacterium]|nr:DUF971 domain-containing protein [bacterium]